MTKTFLVLFIAASSLPSIGEARVRPETPIEELEKEAGEPGNRELSVLPSAMGLGDYRLAVEPFVPNPYGLENDEDSIYRQSEAGTEESGNNTGRSSDKVSN